MTVFNDQATVQVGGILASPRSSSNRIVQRPFIGVMAGLNFNGLRPLDLAAAGKVVRAKIDGDVKLLDSIPFDFKERQPHLFTKEAQRSMRDKVYATRGDAIAPGSPGSSSSGQGSHLSRLSCRQQCLSHIILGIPQC